MVVTLFSLGTIGGFLSGLLGLGGALVLIPLMLAVPPLLGLPELSMKTVAGLSMLQVFFSSLTGVIVHKKNNHVSSKALLFVGFPMGLASFAGALVSRHMDETALVMLFGVLVLVAIIVLFLGNTKEKDGGHNERASDYPVDPLKSIVTGLGVGTVSGMVGAGGGFILIPVMVTVLRLSLKASIGTSLGVVLIGATMGVVGKLVSSQVDILFAVPLVVGSIISASFGARVSNQISPATLRIVLIGVAILSEIQVVLKIL